MTAVLLWLLTELLTKASEKFKVSQTYIALGLSVVLWAWYYVMSNYYSIQREQLVTFVAWVYATSQAIYSLGAKRWIIKKEK